MNIDEDNENNYIFYFDFRTISVVTNYPPPIPPGKSFNQKSPPPGIFGKNEK